MYSLLFNPTRTQTNDPKMNIDLQEIINYRRDGMYNRNRGINKLIRNSFQCNLSSGLIHSNYSINGDTTDVRTT